MTTQDAVEQLNHDISLLLSSPKTSELSAVNIEARYLQILQDHSYLLPEQFSLLRSEWQHWRPAIDQLEEEYEHACF